MYYELYIDSLFCINFVMNLYVLILTNLSLKRTATRFRVILGAAFGAFGYCLMFLLPFLPAWMKAVAGLTVTGMGMVRITFDVRRFSAMTGIYARMLGYSFLVGGMLLFIRKLPFMRGKEMTVIWVLGAGGLCCLCAGGVLADRMKKEKQPFCRVSLHNGERQIQVTALIDTGNSLREPVSGKPVSVISEEMATELFGERLPELYRAVPYRSVGNKRGIMKAYELPELIIEAAELRKQCSQVYIGISREGITGSREYQLILHPQLLE